MSYGILQESNKEWKFHTLSKAFQHRAKRSSRFQMEKVSFFFAVYVFVEWRDKGEVELDDVTIDAMLYLSG